MANGAQQQQRQIGEVLIDDNGDSFTWTRLIDGTAGWKLTALLQAGGGSAVESPQDTVADEGGGRPGFGSGTVSDFLSAAARGVIRSVPGLARSAAQGATWGTSDEIGGAIRGMVTPGMSWREGIEKERQALADVPLHLRIPGEIVGGLASGGLLARGLTSLPRAAGVIGRGMRGQGSVLPQVLGVKRAEQAARALATGTVGATEAAFYGAGQAEGGFGERVRGAAEVAPWGGAAGFALPFIPGIGRLTAPLSGAGSRPLRTGEAIQEGLERGMTTPPMRPTMPDPAALTRTGAAGPVSRRVLGEGRGQTGGLLQALQDRGAEQARVLREAVQEVRDKFYKPLDAKFQRGWNVEIVGETADDARRANTELAKYLADNVLGNADLGSALRGRSLAGTAHVDPDVIRDLGDIIGVVAEGGDLIHMLGHEELSMLRRNLRPLADNVQGAQRVMDEIETQMGRMFGPEAAIANRNFARASQLQNVHGAGRGHGITALTADGDLGKLFTSDKLRTAGGMREAVENLPKALGRELDPAHVAAAERQLKMGRFADAMSKPSDVDLHKFIRGDEGIAWVEELFKNNGRYTQEARKGLDLALLAIRNNAPNLLDNIATQLYRHAGWVVAAGIVGSATSGLLGGGDNR